MKDHSIDSALLLYRSRSQCLNGLQIARLQNGDALDSSAQLHVETCADCRAAARALDAATRAAQLEPIPAALLNVPPRISIWPREGLRTWSLAGTFVAILFSIGLRSLYSPASQSPAVLAKGTSVELLFTVLRNNQYVYEDVDGSTLQLQDGDRLRLRVAGASTAYVIVRTTSAGVTDTVFAGTLAADGLLPEGLRYTATSPTRLEMLACAKVPTNAQDEATCTHRAITL